MNSETVNFVQKNVLLDIEGTTTSIAFVKNTLFSYARKHLEEYLNQNWTNEELQTVIISLKTQCEEDMINELSGVIPIREGEHEKRDIIQNVNWLMDNDRKVNALKKLQGMIWRDGYFSGNLKSHLFDDVVPALNLWKKYEKHLYIYSSGSVEAQKLLFEYSMYGSLLELLSGYFDTNVGPKIETQSYLKIAMEIKSDPKDILFLTDAIKEAEAASAAGCVVIILERPDNAPLTKEEREKYICIKSFQQLHPLS